MPVPTLYDTCIQKTILLFRSGVWNKSKENPFSSLPSTIVDHLVKLTLLLKFRDLPNHKSLYLLLASHRLNRLDLSCFRLYNKKIRHPCNPASGISPELAQRYKKVEPLFREEDFKLQEYADEECNSLLNMLSSDTLSHLGAIILPHFIRPYPSAVQGLIQASQNLVYIHVSCHFDLNILQYCKSLRILKLHNRKINFFNVIRDGQVNFLQYLENLEHFTVCCNSKDYYTDYILIKNCLKNCPKLISVGLCDSSMAIEFIRKFKVHPADFKLKRCFWGIKSKTFSKRLPNYKLNFPYVIQRAAASCPFVVELVLIVHHKSSLQFLSLLKRLTILYLDFAFCGENYMHAFISLLREIGHQLKHLSLKSKHKKTKDNKLYVSPEPFVTHDIFAYCTNLESLKIVGLSTFRESKTSISGISNLKRLYFICFDTSAFIFVLEHSRNLMELSVTFSDDFNYSEILWSLLEVSLPNLRLFCIFSNLSKKLVRPFITKLLKYVKNVGQICSHNTNYDAQKYYAKDPSVYTMSEVSLHERKKIHDMNICPQDCFSWRLNNCVF
ncbi:uncharacterized protein CDAR_291841 [Caerostris darwini]|uniref:F-box domain-containing protein n=1 Tax=Caerostris darwini TaxID=1538125 RepID=A0AAV4NTD4_9ARAC|nr:uncharacterized protein CDAR_291841 [Caerostris darwini]